MCASTAAVAAFNRVVFSPHVLRDVSTVDASTTILGREASLPLVFAPTGFTRMMHAAGESAVARAAGRAGVPYTLSTLGTTSIERLAEETAVFAAELAGAFVSNLEGCTGGVQTIDKHASPRCLQPKLFLILKGTHGGQHPAGITVTVSQSVLVRLLCAGGVAVGGITVSDQMKVAPQVTCP